MYYEHNMKIMQEYRNGLYKRIMEHNSSKPENITARVEKTKSNETALIIESKDDHQTLRLNSIYNPAREAQKWAEQFKIKNLNTVITMFGLGNGIFVRELIEKLDKSSKLLIFEPSFFIFDFVLNEYDLADIISDERIYIVIQDINDYELPAIISALLSWENLFSKIDSYHPGYDKLFPNLYYKYKELIVNNTFNNVMTRNTVNNLGKVIAENAIINMKYLKNAISIWDLEDKLPKNIPVIIAAAGPSLNKNIDILKRAKGKSIILAVDRAYETFLKHDLEPDFLVLLDPIKPLKLCGNKRYFKVPLLCKLEGSPEIMTYHAGRKIIYDCTEYISDIYGLLNKRYKRITTGGSVTTAALSICASLKFTRIIFVGLDLAYLGELSHSEISQDELLGHKQLELYVEDIHGEKIKTRSDWYSFLKWFEYVIIQLPDIDIIDATEGGARINGTRIMTLRDAIEHYCNEKVNLFDIINEAEPTFNEQEMETIYQYLERGQKDLDYIKELSETALKCFNTEKNDSMDINKIFDKISKINKKIMKIPIYSLIDNYVVSEETTNIQELYFLTNDKDKDEKVALENAKKIYAAIVDACNNIEPKLKEAVELFGDYASE